MPGRITDADSNGDSDTYSYFYAQTDADAEIFVNAEGSSHATAQADAASLRLYDSLRRSTAMMKAPPAPMPAASVAVNMPA